MQVANFLNKWYDKKNEDWGGKASPEYRNFETNYRSVIKEMCENIGMELHSFNKNHYEFTAVIKSNTTNQYYYISISDVRYWKNEWANNILYRTMKHDRDWTGGTNHYSALQELEENLLNLDFKILKENENTRQIDNQVKIINDDFDMNYT